MDPLVKKQILMLQENVHTVQEAAYTDMKIHVSVQFHFNTIILHQFLLQLTGHSYPFP